MGNFVAIPGFPMYQMDTDSLEIISFHKSPLGKKRVLEYGDKGNGYTLYDCGKKQYFTLEDLKGTVALHNIKQSLKEKQEMATGIPVKGNFLVGTLLKSTGSMSFSPFPGRHTTWKDANAEAARLAQVDRNKKFIVVEVKGIVSAQEVVWE